jgi:hypothetical protein
MFDKISSWFSTAPDYGARLETNNFIENVIIERGSTGKEPHTLRIEFQQPVRVGNELVQLNVRSEDGTVVGGVPLKIGETGLPIPIEPDHTHVELVGINGDGQVVSTDRIEIRELSP